MNDFNWFLYMYFNCRDKINTYPINKNEVIKTLQDMIKVLQSED